MIAGHFHQGSGLGNQLARYVFTRVKALDLGVPFGMMGDFKGKDFMPINLGNRAITYNHTFQEERVNNEQGVDIRPYDIKTESIHDGALVDGEFQAEKYWAHRENEVREWLKVEPLEMADNLCVINFRGGEYVGVGSVFLPKSYWDEAINQMVATNPNMRFQVHTDDIATAKAFFPNYEIIKDMAYNWRSIRYAKYLIISNSSFAILPAWLNEDAKLILAPKFWAGYNVGYWKMAQNKYEKFTYL